MGLFSKKYSSAQEVELQEFAALLNGIRHLNSVALLKLHAGTHELYSICRVALSEDRSLNDREYAIDFTGDMRHPRWERRYPEELKSTRVLADQARQAVQSYIQFLESTHQKLLSNNAKDWYPKDYKKAHKFWCNNHYQGTVATLKILGQAMDEPDTLKHDPAHGKDNLNVFVQFLNQVAMLSQDVFLPKLF